MSLKHTRAIIDAINEDALANVPTVSDPIFGVGIPKEVPGVPTDILTPRNTWADKDAFDRAARKLAGLFSNNFEQFKEGCSPEILKAAAELEAVTA